MHNHGVIVALCIVGLAHAAGAFEWRQEANKAFTSREHLAFSVNWQFVPVGTAYMDVRSTETVRGRTCYHIVTEARTTSFFDNFFKVRDTNESFMDTESLCSLRFISRLNEGSFHKTEILDIMQEEGRYFVVDSTQSGTIPLWLHDVLSALYYLRTRDLAVDGVYTFDAQSGDKTWPLSVKVLGKERVTVPAGVFHCLVVEPSVRENAGIFQAKGKMTVWLTDDERHMPVMMRSKIVIGSVDATLTEYQR